MNPQTIAIISKVNKIPLYLAVFLIPLFFLGFSQSFLGFPKQLLLLALLTISFSGWFLKQLLQETIVFKKQLFFYGAALSLLVFTGVSTIFSEFLEGSLWGWPMNMAESFVALASFLLLALLMAHSFQKEKHTSFLVKLLTISGAIAAIFTSFQLYGRHLLPFRFARDISFNPVGSVSSVALMAAVLLPISLVLAINSKRFWRPVFILSSLVFLFALILINFQTAWGILALASIILLVFGVKLLQNKTGFIWVGSLMLLLVLSVFFWFFPLRFAFLPSVPIEISPSVSTEANILRGTFEQGAKNVFIGTGPGTFIFNYSRHRSPIINQTIFWGTRFQRGSSVIFDWLATRGLLGGVALVALMGWALYYSFKKLIRFSREEKEHILGPAFFAAVIGLIGAAFFYSFNYVLWFMFWAFLGVLLFHTSKQEKIVNLKGASRKLGIFILFSTLIIVLCLSALFIQTRRYLADVNYYQGIRSAQENKIEEAVSYLVRATEFNNKFDLYQRELGQLYLVKADMISRDETLDPHTSQEATYRAILNGTEAIGKAINISPANVANWNVRGYFYRNLIGLEGAGELALSSYRRATELEPSSPFAYGEMGRVYVLIAQDAARRENEELSKEAFDLAIKELSKALELKSDYAPAHYLLAVVYDQQGKLEEAISKLQDTKRTSPNDAGIAFQLGLLHWRNEDIEQAQQELERAVELLPRYSNARYMLGLVYDRQGEKEQAKEQFEKVAELNPENEEVREILKNLEKGLPAIEEDIPQELPIQVDTPEISI